MTDGLKLTPGQSRVAALLLLLLALAAAYVLVVAPIAAEYRDYDETIAQLRDRLQRYRSLAGTGATTQRELDQLRRRQPSTAYYLKSDKSALASAELQQHIKDRVDSSGAQLVSSQVVPGETSEPFPSVAIKVHMRGDMDSLLKVFYALESGKPILFLDEIYITVNPVRRFVRNRNLPQGSELDIHFTVIGYMRQENV